MAWLQARSRGPVISEGLGWTGMDGSGPHLTFTMSPCHRKMNRRGLMKAIRAQRRCKVSNTWFSVRLVYQSKYRVRRKQRPHCTVKDTSGSSLLFLEIFGIEGLAIMISLDINSRLTVLFCSSLATNDTAERAARRRQPRPSKAKKPGGSKETAPAGKNSHTAGRQARGQMRP